MSSYYKINVLTNWFSSPNETAFLYPLLMHRLALKEFGFQINFYDTINNNLTCCDVIIISSKFYSTKWDNKNINKSIDEIHNLKQNGARIVYADISDSAGVVHMTMLDVVDLYIKNQLYVDKNNYLKPLYGYRLYSDFFYEKFNILDVNQAFSKVVSNKKLLNKVHLGWNSGLGNYGKYGYLIQVFYKIFKYNLCLPYPRIFKQNINKRIFDVNMRFNITYSRKTISYMRKSIIEKFSYTFGNGSKLNRFQYFEELKKSKIILSPFGLGEITLKDFETFLTGGLLLKPNMDHMITWPNLYKENQNVIFFNWDLSDLEDKIEYCISNYDEVIKIANNGQKDYFRYIGKKTSAFEFIKHFKGIIQKLY